jgi:hypothetical protein
VTDGSTRFLVVAVDPGVVPLVPVVWARAAGTMEATGMTVAPKAMAPPVAARVRKLRRLHHPLARSLRRIQG